MDRNLAFTEAMKKYDISQIQALLKLYPHNLQFVILEWWNLKYDPQGRLQISELLYGAIDRLTVNQLKLYFDLLVADNLYIEGGVAVEEVKHDYQKYYEYAKERGREEIAEFLKIRQVEL